MKDLKRFKIRDESGRSFGSGLERARFKQLELLERGGVIRDLKCQVQVHLSRARILYKPDFSYFDVALDQIVYEETKGFETAVWAIKKRLWRYYGPGLLRIWKGSAAYLIHDEDIIPKAGEDESWRPGTRHIF